VGYQREDILASLRLVLPVVAAVLASVAILLHAELTEARSGIGVLHWLGPFAVSFGLLLLAILRQELTFLENARLQRERAEARAYEQALRALNRRKDEFLSVVSHELRTPLASLRGYIELLVRRFDAWWPPAGAAAERARPVAWARAALAGAEESVRRLSRLGDDLLDDARMRAGRLALRPEPCDLGAIVRAAVEEQQALAPNRSIHLALPITQTVPVLADAMRIEQVVTNYLTNALKYSKEDRPVVVRLEVGEAAGEGAEEGAEERVVGGAVGGAAQVSVRDEGIGVPLAEQEHVWERFAVVAGTTVQSGSGSSLGLGLHICKSIIEAHHGHVGLDSVPGQGATFWFTLPLALPTASSPGAD
jgi:signal transduction histidine kinase